MLPDGMLIGSSLPTWLALLALSAVVARLAERLQDLDRRVTSTIESERLRERLGQPVPPLALVGADGERLVLGLPPAAPAVVLALSQRCPPCAAFWERLGTLAASLRDRGILLVLAAPERDAPLETTTFLGSPVRRRWLHSGSPVSPASRWSTSVVTCAVMGFYEASKT